jgi:hypothetical protein
MDPFIEGCGLFEDFHPKLIGEIERSLSRLVPDHYAVRLGERSYIVLASRGKESRRHQMLPDVAVLAATPSRKRRGTTATAVHVAEEANGTSVTMQALLEVEFREMFIEIRQLRPQRRLITTIELLSPSNKRPDTPGWQLYLRKRQSSLGRANLVEIDLLRGGRRMPMADDWPESPYYVLVCRKQDAPRCSVWPAFSLKSLPPLRVPLDPPDSDVTLDLQALANAVSERSHYGEDIDYRKSIRPRLGEDEGRWLRQQLRHRRK